MFGIGNKLLYPLSRLASPFALFEGSIEVLLTLSTVCFLGVTFTFPASSIFSSLLQLHGPHPAT